tara:strand:- start:386 stop:559 length:174 start_codon:yes stop_codon:yes gene_type:complete
MDFYFYDIVDQDGAVLLTVKTSPQVSEKDAFYSLLPVLNAVRAQYNDQELTLAVIVC